MEMGIALLYLQSAGSTNLLPRLAVISNRALRSLPDRAEGRLFLLLADVGNQSRAAGDQGEPTHDSGRHAGITQGRRDGTGGVDGDVLLEDVVHGAGQRLEGTSVVRGELLVLDELEQALRARIVGLVQWVAETGERAAGLLVFERDSSSFGVQRLTASDDAVEEQGAAFH